MDGERRRDVILGWMVPPPAGAPEPPEADVVSDLVGLRQDVLQRAVQHVVPERRGSPPPPLLVRLDGATLGLAKALWCSSGLALFQGFCELEGLKDGKDFVDLGTDKLLGTAELVLVKQDLLFAFLCRAWARDSAFNAVRPVLALGFICPFDSQGSLVLATAEDAADHYLQLLLGTGNKDRCPQAEKYLQGVARDMTLGQLPYLSEVLKACRGLSSETTVLGLLAEPAPGASAGLPRDIREDMALVIASKALELVQAIGLDL